MVRKRTDHSTWHGKLGIGPDPGTGFTDAEVDALSMTVDVEALDAYRIAVQDEMVSWLNAIADDAAAVLHHLGIDTAHVAGFSGGSRNAQELALRHPDVVRSLVLCSTWPDPDPFLRQIAETLSWVFDAAPSPRSALEAFFLWIYTPRAHNDGTVAAILEQALASPCRSRRSTTSSTRGCATRPASG